MRIAFRQGLIAFQQDAGTPKYLQPSSTSGFVSHVVSPTPTIVTFAHAGSDYLIKFDSTTNLGWQITQPQTTYLYWDIDQLTTEVTRGTTILIPINSLSAPPAPVNDQHWFDLTTNTMQVWNASRNKWVTRIRLFAGTVNLGNTNSLTMFTAGSQIGLNTPSNPGYIMLDSMLQPLKKSTLNGEFLTDEDEARVLTTVGTSGVLVQPVSHVVPVRAGEAIPRMSMVYFSAADTIRLATSEPGTMPARPPVGICMDALASGEVGTVVQTGEITYDQWDWSAFPGAPLYCDSFGQITTVRPAGLMAFRVGFVKNAKTVLLMVDSETNPQVYQAGPSDLIFAGATPVILTDVINGIGERVVTTTVPDATTVQRGLMTGSMVVQLNGYGTRLTSAEGNISVLQTSKADVVHTHIIADTTGLQAALDGKSPITHNHDLVYAPIVHNHDLVYSMLGHVHLLGEVTGLQNVLDQKAFRSNGLTKVSEVFTTVDRTGVYDAGSGATLQDLLDGKSAVGHTHPISDVTNLQTTLNGKAALVHTHVIADVYGLQNELDQRAFVSHTHTISNVSGLQTALDGKAALVHTHVIADTTGLQAALDGKAAVSHNHALSTLSDVNTTGAASGQVLSFNGTSWVPVTPSSGGGSSNLITSSDFTF